MDDIISQEFGPYLLVNAALHPLAECERCDRCYLKEKSIAVSIDDCRRIARHLGLSLKRFMTDYTRPRELKGDLVGSARMLSKNEDSPCPFFDSSLLGCRIYSVKPQVCTAAPYLFKMSLLTCEEQQKIGTFPICFADGILRAKISEFVLQLDEDTKTKSELVRSLCVRTARGGALSPSAVPQLHGDPIRTGEGSSSGSEVGAREVAGEWGEIERYLIVDRALSTKRLSPDRLLHQFFAV
jgi:Fe-S-cluster containining protein